MNIKSIITELDDIIDKLKVRIIYLQSENKDLKKKVNELKEYIKNL